MHLFNWSAAWPPSLGRPRPVKDAPDHSPGGAPGRLAAPRKNALMLSLLVSTKSSLQLNDIIISYN